MREIPLGELSNLKLFDVLKTLLVEKKSGILVVKGKETGELSLESGNIVHAKVGLLSGEEAFLAIMAWRMGKSVFKQDVGCKERTISCPAEDLLLKWSYRKQEWEEIRELVPSSGAVFRLSLQQNPGEMNIRTNQWNVLALANGVRTVWLELQALRTDTVALDPCTGDTGRRVHGHAMLETQTGFAAVGTDARQMDRLSCQQRQRQRTAQHLAAALAHRPIDCDHARTPLDLSQV